VDGVDFCWQQEATVEGASGERWETHHQISSGSILAKYL